MLRYKQAAPTGACSRRCKIFHALVGVFTNKLLYPIFFLNLPYNDNNILSATYGEAPFANKIRFRFPSPFLEKVPAGRMRCGEGPGEMKP